jgi:hypothetical protein
MPPKDKEAKKSVSFQGTQASKKEKSVPARDDSDGDKRTASLEAPLLGEVYSAAAVPSDGASNSIDAKGPVESLDNEGFVPPIEQHGYRPSGDDGEVIRMDDGDGEQRSSRDEVVDIDELPVDDDG